MKQKEFLKTYFSFIILIFSIFISLFCYKKYSLWKTDNKNTKNIINELKEVPKQEIKTNLPVNFLNIDFTDLIKTNKDTVAWIKINNTLVDYPVVQYKDNDYYMKRDFYKNNNEAGTIFSDYRNNFLNLNKNTILYGHSRLDNTMFGSLRFMLNEEFFSEPQNNYIIVSTPYYNSIWQIFSVYKIPKENYFLTALFKDGEYDVFLNTILNRSYYNFNTSVSPTDYTLTLSTCGDSDGLTRIIVHAKLIKKESTKAF